MRKIVKQGMLPVFLCSFRWLGDERGCDDYSCICEKSDLRSCCNPQSCEIFKQTIEAKNITIENLMFLVSDASNDEIFISYSKKKISEVRLSE